jgi:hypothetical protein
MENVETVEVTVTERHYQHTEGCEHAAAAKQQQSRDAGEVEVHEMWEAKAERELQYENAHFEPDSEVFDAAERAMEVTSTHLLVISAMTDEALHAEVVNSRDVFLRFCAKTQAHVRQRLIPLCEEIIKRFKRPGLAGKYRLNGQPTVEAYFRSSLGLNYSTVRSWFALERYGDHEKLRTPFRTPSYRPHFPMIEDNTPHTTTGRDFEKIRKLANKIVEVALAHDIDLRPAATDLLIIAGQQFATKGEAEWLDPAGALRHAGRSEQQWQS